MKDLEVGLTKIKTGQTAEDNQIEPETIKKLRAIERQCF